MARLVLLGTIAATGKSKMHRCLLLSIALSSTLALQVQAQSHEYWANTEMPNGAIEDASQLYPEEATAPYPAIVKLEQKPSELSDLYTALENRSKPMKILTFPRPPAPPKQVPTSFEPGSLEDLMVRFVHRFEAPAKGYDAVWHKNKHPLPRIPTQMTVCEVRTWQLEAREIQASTAIGAYQIVGGTFRETLEQLGLGCDVLFDKATQDMFGLALLYKRGWPDFVEGTLPLEDFAYELAGEWAAFPAPYGKNKGYSRHRGVAGNKHQVELPEFIEFLKSLKETAKAGGSPSLALNAKPKTEASATSDVLVVQIDEGSSVSEGLQKLN